MREKTKKQFGIKEISKMAGVSIGTVDRVIHDRPGVSPKTKERVQKIIDEVGYDPNPIARRLAGFNQVYSVAVIIPTKTDYSPYWGEHLGGIEKALSLVGQFGIEVEPLFFNQDNESSFLDATAEFFDKKYDAAVLVPIFQEKSKELADKCARLDIPIVCIDTDLADAQKLSFIGQDSYQSGVLAGKVGKWRLGQNDKALVCHATARKDLTENFKKREQGFSNSLEIAPENILRAELNPQSEEQMREEIQSVLTKHPDTKVIFIPNTRSFLIVPCLTKEQQETIFIIGYDLIEANINLLKQGRIDVLISQKPLAQCYKGIILLYDKLISKKSSSPELEMPIDILLKENIDYYLHETQQV